MFCICSPEVECQTVCKPGSVPSAKFPWRRGWPFIWDARRRTPRATDPSGGAKIRPAWPCGHACRSYLVLLPVGFSLPPPLLSARCALTAPFHPCHARGRSAVCFLWHYPWGRPRRPLTGTASPWSPDFPLPIPKHQKRPSDRLAWDDMGRLAAAVKIAAKPQGIEPPLGRFALLRRLVQIYRRSAAGWCRALAVPTPPRRPG